MILQKASFYTTYALFYLVFLSSVSCQTSNVSEIDTNYNLETKIDGMTLVAPPRPFPSNPTAPLVEASVDWVAVVPYAYTRQNDTGVSFGNSTWQWWGEKPEGARETIKVAKEAGLKVMLKPQVYVPGSWTGGIDFANDEAWKTWEANYEKYIMTFAKIAAEEHVALFCIGTEFKVSSRYRPEFWIHLIEKIKTVYDGKLTYAANWDEYPHITWWDKVDYIGVDAYFPLSDSAVPSVDELIQAWRPVAKKMENFSSQYQRPILFTEFGYMSVEGCAGKTWVLEKDRSILKYNEQAQANAFEALYQALWPTDFWAGGFIWKWYPNEFASGNRMRKDYTPQNKQGLSTLSKWYLKKTHSR